MRWRLSSVSYTHLDVYKRQVIAVPTSVGYGANFGGLSALLSMLNSCASGVSVVNIDNGFGAGYLASMINHMWCGLYNVDYMWWQVVSVGAGVIAGSIIYYFCN